MLTGICELITSIVEQDPGSFCVLLLQTSKPHENAVVLVPGTIVEVEVLLYVLYGTVVVLQSSEAMYSTFSLP
jgi:hypothetical protein